MDLVYLNGSASRYYNLSIACMGNPSDGSFKNLTWSYTQQLHDASTLSASFIMFSLTAVFFILTLFSHLSDVSAILDPKVRVGLTSALSLFLPVMSYLFSEAKNNGGTDVSNSKTAELPQRARFILIWMLLVELLRKKVEEIRMQGYSGTIERAGRVIWLGSLVFSNLQETGRKAMTGILWLLCASKLVQRISFTEFGKRSLAFGKNANLITSYMAQVLGKDDQLKQGHCLRPEDSVDDLLKRCKYAVMDEDKLVVEATPSGYRLKEDDSDAATVGKIWGLAETDPLFASLDGDKRRLRRLCLSFSLFKLLRRRFEHLPARRRFEYLPALTTAETRSYRQIIFRGLHDKQTITSEVFFDVTNGELNFLCEYYHSVVPVVLASPFFLLANYILLPVVVFVLCFVLIVLSSNGDVRFAFRSMKNDNYYTFFGLTQRTRCLPDVFRYPIVFFSTVDLAITFLLFIIFMYEEVWEVFVFLLSDWFLVSLLCKYATDPLRRTSDPAVTGSMLEEPSPLRGLFRRRTFGFSVRCIMFARSLMYRPAISLNQFSVLQFCGITMPAHIPLKFPILVRAVPVSKEVKDSITGYFTKLYDRDGNMMTNAPTLSNGRNALERASHGDLSPFCDSYSVAEVILTWHIATSLLEVEHPDRSSNSDVATSLSRYCAYLVAFNPELLPENQDNVDRVFKALKLELFQLLGLWGYYFSQCRNTRYRKLKSAGKPEEREAEAVTATVVVKGATLGSILARKAAQHSAEAVWNVLADLWVELIVYIAPSSDDGAHENVLDKGGEFITVLWAMATHAGIARPAGAVPAVDHTEGTTSDVFV